MTRYFSTLIISVVYLTFLLVNFCFAYDGPITLIQFNKQSALTSANLRNDWIRNHLANQLGANAKNGLAVRAIKPAINGHQVISLVQTYQNIPVVGTDSNLILNQTLEPILFSGKHQNFSGNVGQLPLIDLSVSLINAGMNHNYEYQQQLMYWQDPRGHLKLSYVVDGTFIIRHVNQNQRVYIDAISGKVLKRDNHSHTLLRRRVSDFRAACQEIGVRWPLKSEYTWNRLNYIAVKNYSRKEGMPLTGNIPVDQGHAFLSEAYTFMKSLFHIDSVDNRGRLLQMFVSVKYPSKGTQWPQCVGSGFNATWVSNKQSLYIPSSGLNYPEILLHELAHGIISNGSDLVYESQSGALNESIADAAGVAFRVWKEYTNHSLRLSNKIPRLYWKMRMPTGVMRDLADPSSIGRNPDHYSDYVRMPLTPRTDNGGVHINSSIMNMAFYLLSEGGKHPRHRSKPVKGVGIFKAANIFVSASRGVLFSRSSFKDARYAFARTAEMLYGKKSTEWRAVHQAMDAVGIPGTWVDVPPVKKKVEKLPDPVAKKPVKQKTSKTDKPKSKNQQPPNPSPKQPPKEEATKKPEKVVTTPKSKKEDAVSSNNILAVIMFGLAALIAAILVIFKIRPKEEKSEEAVMPFAETNESRDGLFVKKTANHTRPDDVLGYLNYLSGDHVLPLKIKYLNSDEGLVLGRSADVVHIQLASQFISRRHLRIKQSTSGLIVEDLNSSSGTQLDGISLDPYKPQKIKSGQVLTISNFSYQLKIS